MLLAMHRREWCRVKANSTAPRAGLCMDAVATHTAAHTPSLAAAAAAAAAVDDHSLKSC